MCMLKIALLFCSLIGLIGLIGCASIERDLYFRNIDARVSRWPGYPQPGICHSSEPIKIDESGSVSISVKVLNHASGSYLWGFVVPEYPVFFLPGFQFHLNPHDNLKIHCSVTFELDKKYRDPKWGFLTEEGIKLSENRKKNSYGQCESMEIILADGRSFKPIQSIKDKNDIIFEFEYPAEKIKKFAYVVSEVRLYNDQKVRVDVQNTMVFEDFIRYYIYPFNGPGNPCPPPPYK